jgi:hypothetical protein
MDIKRPTPGAYTLYSIVRRNFMRDFSLDIQAEKIYSSKTKEYFEEVIKSYYSESYRSAVVILYSISVADLVYKIENLKELYGDSNATEILKKITEMQEQKPNSAEWETKLIELVKEKTNLLEPSDYLHLTTLQKHRHLCAHPVLTQNFELYRPNKETTRAHIRNMLEGILTKPPLLSRKVFDDLLSNLAEVKSTIFNNIQLENYLKEKYLDRVNPNTIKHIFRSLWKITFKVSDTQCDKNREINLRALTIIFKNNYHILFDLISTERDYYSDIAPDNFLPLIALLNQFPKISELINDSTRILLENTIKRDANLDAFAVFRAKDVASHLQKVLTIRWDSNYDNTDIGIQSILVVFEFAVEQSEREQAHNFLIEMFGKSSQYSIADSRFSLIAHYLDDFNMEELELIVKKIDDNSQIYDRWKAKETNRLVKKRMEEICNDFDFSKYDNFKC